MLLIVGGTEVYYIIQRKTDPNAILKDNDQSIDSLVQDPAAARARFSIALGQQEQNETENGEASAT